MLDSMCRMRFRKLGCIYLPKISQQFRIGVRRRRDNVNSYRKESGFLQWYARKRLGVNEALVLHVDKQRICSEKISPKNWFRGICQNNSSLKATRWQVESYGTSTISFYVAAIRCQEAGLLRAKPGPGTKIKTGPHANDKYNCLPKMIERMIRHTIHFVILKSINNQKKVNNTLE